MVTGDIATQRISIEEGAYLKGKVDIQGKADKAAAKPTFKTSVNSKSLPLERGSIGGRGVRQVASAVTLANERGVLTAPHG